MNVFVVARDAEPFGAESLVQSLNAIQTEDALRNSIIAVDSLYNLPADRSSDPVSLKGFRLDDFVHERGGVVDGKVVLATNRIAEQLGALAHEWLVIDFGQHEFYTCEDFVKKLATCLFMFPPARQLKLAFVIPRVQLPLYLRTCNTAFNVLPEGRSFSSTSAQTNMLFLSVVAEKGYSSFYPIIWPISKLREILRFFYNRIIRAKI
ncbi:hypothetical protein [Pseudomonas sp. MF4836]|uniref:hypothetical protein n=1 Tax=Pseudomonas sp. MF4836 TaxID=1960827 RepID=UPI000995F1CD|nr:hypothetical protein [Pseudomonas sp. MF4836]OOV89103.1 hypothetical protein MF4836_34395 [Pseudomonas sp. MF4836]